MKTRFVKIFNTALVAGTVAMLFLAFQIFTQAQDDGAAEPAAEGEAVATSDCVDNLATKMLGENGEIIKFGDYINAHFQSPLPTSQLIPAAIDRYRALRQFGRREVDNFLKDPRGGGDPMDLLADRKTCEIQLQKYFEIVEAVLKPHIAANAYAKKSTRLLDKYKELNDKLNRLNFTVAQLYGYFSALSQKLPCYATKCVKG